MAKKKFVSTLSMLAAIATIVSVLILVVTTLFPNLITDTTKQAINFDTQYRKPDGDVRPGVVPAQTNAFLIAFGIIILIWGFSLAGFYYIGTKNDASSVAVGGGRKKGLLFLMFIMLGIFFLILGVNLPRAIFDPTNMRALEIYFGLAASAKKSWLAGFALGFIGFLVSLVVAAAAFSLFVILPRNLKKRKFEKSLRLQY